MSRAKERIKLGNRLTKREGGKSQAKNFDVHQILKDLVKSSAKAIKGKKKDPLVGLHQEAKALAKRLK